jgi:cyclophilin family peptidyl-prolyl cis-trans isomerase
VCPSKPSRLPPSRRVLPSLLSVLAAGSVAADPPLPEPSAIPPVEAIVSVHQVGEFRIEFYRDDAPNHVAHFLSLVAAGFYDGLSFHRVIPELLIQTGDPASRDDDRHNDGPGSVDFRVPFEPVERPVLRGSVVMAWRASEPGTAGSQWFVSLGDFPEMKDGTVIGEVVAGMDVVDRISQVSTLRNRNPYHRVAIDAVRLAGPEPVPTDPE